MHDDASLQSSVIGKTIGCNSTPWIVPAWDLSTQTLSSAPKWLENVDITFCQVNTESVAALSFRVHNLLQIFICGLCYKQSPFSKSVFDACTCTSSSDTEKKGKQNGSQNSTAIFTVTQLHLKSALNRYWLLFMKRLPKRAVSALFFSVEQVFTASKAHLPHSLDRNHSLITDTQTKWFSWESGNRHYQMHYPPALLNKG